MEIRFTNEEVRDIVLAHVKTLFEVKESQAMVLRCVGHSYGDFSVSITDKEEPE